MSGAGGSGPAGEDPREASSRQRGVLARIDDRVLPRLRRVAEAVVGPVRRLRAWEASPQRGRLVRNVARRPQRVAVAASLVVLLAAGVHLERYPDLVAQRAGGGAGGSGTLVALEVGPRVGADLAGYVAGRHELLDALTVDEPVRAIVSFAEVVTLEGLPLPGSVTVEAVQLVVPAQELDPRQLDLREVDDPDAILDRLFEAERAALEEEITELASTLEEDLGDPAFEEDFRRRLEELEEAREALDDDVPLVFAAVVVADLEVLRELRDDAAVRAVDPAGPATATQRARFFGILPSDTDRASTGRPL